MSTSTTARPPRATDADRDWWTLAEWAQLYGFSKNGSHAMAARGEIPGAVKFGRRWRISKVAFTRAFHGSAPDAA